MKLPKKCPPQTDMLWISVLHFCILRLENSKFPSARRERKPPWRFPGVRRSGKPRLTCADQESRPGRRATVPFRGHRREHRNRDKDRVRQLGPTQRPPPPRPGNARPPPAAGPGARRGPRKLTSGRGRWRGPRRAVASRPRPQFAQGPRAPPPPPRRRPSHWEHYCPQTLSSSAAAPLRPCAPPSVTAARRRGRAEAGSAQTRERARGRGGRAGARGGGAGGAGRFGPQRYPREWRPPLSSRGRCCSLPLHPTREMQRATYLRTQHQLTSVRRQPLIESVERFTCILTMLNFT